MLGCMRTCNHISWGGGTILLTTIIPFLFTIITHFSSHLPFTNILCIHGCHTRTNILYIHGCHTRTNHKEMSVVTHVFHTLETFIVKKTSSIKAKFRCQKFLRRSIHGCMRTCKKFSWGVCWDLEMSYFHPLYLPLFLTFHCPINLLSYHFHTYMWVSPYYFHFIHFSIISEFMIKILEINILFTNISSMDELCNV